MAGGVNQEIHVCELTHRSVGDPALLHLYARISHGSLYRHTRLTPVRCGIGLLENSCLWGLSFNYLIRPCKQVRRNGDANLLRCLEIDRQIEFGRLHQGFLSGNTIR